MESGVTGTQTGNHTGSLSLQGEDLANENLHRHQNK